ncbi:hypothetical protein T01_11231 [Trichinella spiralis]|uniref:Uncharacterized protein n=1 Tax=Trichinella spiralis TaxID=6334 RepID=A0A0V1AQD1_TRISP|nr:hypothetical protein T01_11231 [Trichinella spiralis]
MASFVTHKYNSKSEKSSADVMKGVAYKVRTKYPYCSEGQSRSSKQQPVMRNNQDSYFNASHLCPSSGRQANLYFKIELRTTGRHFVRLSEFSRVDAENVK